jgi:hypothetical protein
MAQAENAVMYAVEQVCSLYGVQVTREQSRQFNVQGAAGRWRPMFFGTWTDTTGELTHRVGKRITNVWNKGKADFLARPRVGFMQHTAILNYLVHIAVPLWIECKSLDGKQTPEQMAFQRWVERNGDAYLLLREDVRPLIAWFDEHGVTKSCSAADLRTVTNPPDASIIDSLPCRWCKKPKVEHIGVAFGCAGTSGKVWSPDLRRTA